MFEGSRDVSDGSLGYGQWSVAEERLRIMIRQNEENTDSSYSSEMDLQARISLRPTTEPTDELWEMPLSPTLSESWTTDSDVESLFCDNFSEDDDSNDSFYDSLFLHNDCPRLIDSGWGGECLREIEDIDFEFVYALHTFVATVEGQANATKGDTMVLLDDSNSYWWLVRVVKDSSIGMAFDFFEPALANRC